jgi:hypothetical protein
VLLAGGSVLSDDVVTFEACHHYAAVCTYRFSQEEQREQAYDDRRARKGRRARVKSKNNEHTHDQSTTNGHN